MGGYGSALRLLGVGLIASGIVLSGPAAFAQVGVPVVTPVTPPPPPAPPSGGDVPEVFREPHPVFPWHYPWGLRNRGLVLRQIEVLPRSVVLPMEVPRPGSLPSTVEMREVTLPGYRITERIDGFIVHGHWGVRPVGTAYYWTFVPTHFRSK